MNFPSQTVMIERYKRYLIHGTARVSCRTHPNGVQRARSSYREDKGQLSNPTFRRRIFEDRQLTEAHGLALCRKWIDKRS